MSEYNTNRLENGWVKRSIIESFNLSLNNPPILFAVVIVMMAINYFSNYYGDTLGTLSSVIGAAWLSVVFAAYFYVDTGHKIINISNTAKNIAKMVAILLPYIIISNFANMLFLDSSSEPLPIKIGSETILHLVIFILNSFGLYLFVLIPLYVFFALFFGNANLKSSFHYTAKGFFDNFNAFVYIIIVSAIAKVVLFEIAYLALKNLNIVLVVSIVSIYINVIITGILYVILRDIFIGKLKRKQRDSVKAKNKLSVNRAVKA